MDQATPMDLAKCCRQANSDAQDARQIERLTVIPHKVPLKDQIQGLTARVFEDENRPPFVTSERPAAWLPTRDQARLQASIRVQAA
jgi:hypothetical protein